jgi:hypothetical protein
VRQDANVQYPNYLLYFKKGWKLLGHPGNYSLFNSIQFMFIYVQTQQPRGFYIDVLLYTSISMSFCVPVYRCPSVYLYIDVLLCTSISMSFCVPLYQCSSVYQYIYVLLCTFILMSFCIPAYRCPVYQYIYAFLCTFISMSFCVPLYQCPLVYQHIDVLLYTNISMSFCVPAYRNVEPRVVSEMFGANMSICQKCLPALEW